MPGRLRDDSAALSTGCGGQLDPVPTPEAGRRGAFHDRSGGLRRRQRQSRVDTADTDADPGTDADSHTHAGTDAYAYAYAYTDSDPYAYADTYAHTNAHTDSYAHTDTDEPVLHQRVPAQLRPGNHRRADRL